MASGTNVSAPYGLKPINLIGGQVFAGSTRALPIQYGYATNIFYGDFVKVLRGNVTRASVSTGTASAQFDGIFLGCSYTDPVTKTKRFSQYWPASTLAGDCIAYVADDPDTVFKVAVCSSGTTMASGAVAMIGANLSMVNNTGDVNTGNSKNAVLAPTATPVSTVLPVRCIGVVEDTAYSYTATGSSTTTTINLTGSGAPAALPVGTSVAYYASNGQLIETGSFVSSAASAGASTVTINAAVSVPGGVTDIPASSTIVFTVYPEVLVKANLLVHAYYSSTSGQ
jgi:hypothetical protein